MELCKRFYYNGMETDYIIYSNNSGVYSIKSNKFLKPSIDRNGYVNYTLYLNGKPKQFGYHQLVAETFLEKPEFPCEVDHITGDKSKNSAMNLEWVTRKENVRRSVKLGLKKGKFGGDNPSSIYSDQMINDAIALLLFGVTIDDVSIKIGIPKSFIYGLVCKKNRPSMVKDVEFPETIFKRKSKNNKRLPPEVVSEIKFRHNVLNQTAKQIAGDFGMSERRIFQAFYYK